jgi:hypothetical protein
VKNKAAKSPNKLLKWIKDLNPGLHIGRWTILERKPGPKGQRLILLTDQDSHTSIKETRY